MIVIIVDASGNVRYQSSGAIHQGSVNANKVMLVGPFPSAVITVAATLPNGKVYGYDLLKAREEEKAEYALTSLGNLGGAYLDGSELFAYSYTLKGALTAKAGTLKLQFFINTGRFVEGGTESEIFATNNVTVNVINGSKWLPSEPVAPGNIYTEIMEKLSALTTAVEGAKDASEDAKESADNAWNHANIAYNIASTVDVRESENFSNLDTRLFEVEKFFEVAEGETLNKARDTLIEIQQYIDEHGNAASKLTEQVNTNKENIAHLEDNETWDLVITAEKLEGTDLNAVLATASGRVFIKAVGNFQGTTINVPGAVKLIEFAPSVVFGGGMPTVVSIKGTGNESDCQIIKGASTSSADPSYMGQCIIEGFKGGVEHCHGEGWVYENCNNIEHCTFSSFENCKNISKCTSDRGAYNEYYEVTIIDCTDIEDLQLADTTPRGYRFSNSKFIKNITYSTGTSDISSSLTFENCAYISNVEIQSYYTDCTFVDAYTCAGFLSDEDIGKVQKLTKDGTFAVEEVDTYLSTDESIAYEKSVPDNACPYAKINNVYGLTVQTSEGLTPANVEKIISKKDGVIIDEISIPDAVKGDAMWGFGVKNVGLNLSKRRYFANTYYFDSKQYVKWVTDKITIDGTKVAASNVYTNSQTGNWCVSVKIGTSSYADYTAIAVSKFIPSMSFTYGTAYIAGMSDGVYAIIFISADVNTLEKANEWFKNNPVEIQYALAEPTIKTIEDVNQSYISVKGGGTIVCENTNKAAAMCSITYLLKGDNT